MIPFFKNLKECAKIVKNIKVQDFLCNYTMMSQQIFFVFKYPVPRQTAPVPRQH